VPLPAVRGVHDGLAVAAPLDALDDGRGQDMLGLRQHLDHLAARTVSLDCQLIIS
jgi:hypothetical protein